MFLLKLQLVLGLVLKQALPLAQVLLQVKLVPPVLRLEPVLQVQLLELVLQPAPEQRLLQQRVV